jgi:hypothetical protein
MRVHAGILLAAASLGSLAVDASGCGSSADDDPASDPADGGRRTDALADDAGDVGANDGGLGGDGAPSTACVPVDVTTPLAIGSAGAADEYALAIEAEASSATAWKQKGNEAVVLDVLRGAAASPVFIGHLVLHQGKDRFVYTMQAGALAAGEQLFVRVSNRTATNASPSACIGKSILTPASALGAAGEGLKNAPVFKWPLAKRFDDLPVVLGWSKGGKSYQAVYTNENGGTVALCGGGADGMLAEIARWGRGADIEGAYSYGGASPQWERCDGTVASTPGSPRMESAHPVLYYGDGHNRLFESRGGYGQTCGTDGDKKADGDLQGWNVQNPGNEASKDDAFALTVRPLPVDLDALGYRNATTGGSGRREALIDTYAPWLYRITSDEIAREGKIDGTKCLAMDRYLYVDVRAADVGGRGDRTCGGPLGVSGGFVLRAKSKDGTVSDGPQMTADYFGGGVSNWKRIAVPLDKAYVGTDIKQLIFDAYDNDGIYLLEIGDAFIPQPSGTNGATLDYVRKGAPKNIDVYVDDGNSGCVNGFATGGPPADAGYPCVGGAYTLTP